MRSLLSFQMGGPPGSGCMAHFASALALVSRSISAYTLVVSTETFPSHARMVLMSTPARRRCVKDILAHAHLKTLEAYVQADLEMKRRALETTPTPVTVGPRIPRHEPDILHWLEQL